MISSSFEPKSYTAELFAMKKAANRAAMGLVRDFGELEKLQVSRKGVGDYVTSADIRAEKKIMDTLSGFDFKYSFLSEEAGVKETEDKYHKWIIDPIDGTNNFRRGIPYFCTSIALIDNATSVAGLILDPIRGSCYKAAANSGAFVDGRNRLRVSKINSIREALVAYNNISYDIVGKMSDAKAILRKTGSVALDLAFLAAGKYDVVIAHEVSLWDIAAGIVLIREAGGFVRYKVLPNDKYDLIATASFKLLNQVPFKI
ncbi:MAG: inositol monophosphatase [Alphaproteobacteria bacterium]|nr:inositol monophosphatase [Alphaproteobacteria bacterium]